MKFSDRQSKFIFGGVAVIVILIALLKWRAYKLAQTANPQNTLDATTGAQGVPISPAFQYGQQSPFQINLGDYTAQVPQFHYDGNQTVYMPLFGFVGYGA